MTGEWAYAHFHQSFFLRITLSKLLTAIVKISNDDKVSTLPLWFTC